MNVGIVGHEAAKFTRAQEQQAREIIRGLLADPAAVMVSGHCHLGGVDIWAEQEADRLGREKLVFAPRTQSWEHGYKPRNLLIAQASDIVHCIVVRRLPERYTGMRFGYCYHCKTADHVKSGGCWTALRCRARQWHVID